MSTSPQSTNQPRIAGRHFLQIPGPSPVPDRILQAMAMPVIDHRGPAFQKLGQRVLSGIKTIFKTEGPVIIYPASGTGAWEAALANVMSPGDKILMYESGHFAFLWQSLALKLGLQPEFIASDWRHGVDPARIEERLRQDGGREIKAVCVVHNETSTGATSDIQAAKLDVINNLSQVPPGPADAIEPQVFAGGGRNLPGAASLLIRVLPDNPNKDLSTYQGLIEEYVQPRLARIPGVSRVDLQGERPREVHITFDAYRAAALGIQINDIIATISRATDSSGGFADVGRRQYTVRFVGQFEPDQLNELIVGWSNDRPVYLTEVADVDA